MKSGTSIKKVDRNQYRMSHLGASSPQADDRELAAFATPPKEPAAARTAAPK